MAPEFSMVEVNRFMREAIDEAKRAGSEGEIPVGCVIVDQSGSVIARGHNTREKKLEIHGHAEINAINAAAAAKGSLALQDCALFVTLEPCPMCMGAIAAAQIPAVYTGAAATSISGENSVRLDPWSYPFDLFRGILGDTCEELLKNFFKKNVRK